MTKNLGRKFKKGAASFYIVAFATLILVVVATSFAIVTISEISRTSNDDLSQSAYDAALAGVEDAKLAYANYRACIAKQSTYPEALTSSSDVTCQDIVYFMNHPDCDMVAHMLGRIGKTEHGEVLIRETATTDNNMNEAYTCVMIETTLSDYRASLSSSNLYQIIKVNLAGNATADKIKKVKISWYSNREGGIYNFTNLLSDGKVAFQPVRATKVATPPIISVGLVQTSQSFNLDQLNGATVNGQTDRATMFFIPTNDINVAKKDTNVGYNGNSQISIYDLGSSKNKLTAEQIASTNDHMKDVPFVVYCDPSSSDEFLCSVEMDLPEPIGGNRSNDTFMFVVTLPYEQPDTDFSLEFICADNTTCSSQVEADGTTTESNLAMTDGVQVVIDSTGRANDLYRRVEMRLETSDSMFAYPIYAIQALGNGSGNTRALIIKNKTATTR